MPVKSQVSAKMECQPLGFNTKHHSESSTQHYIIPKQEYESENQEVEMSYFHYSTW